MKCFVFRFLGVNLKRRRVCFVIDQVIDTYLPIGIVCSYLFGN